MPTRMDPMIHNRVCVREFIDFFFVFLQKEDGKKPHFKLVCDSLGCLWAQRLVGSFTLADS